MPSRKMARIAATKGMRLGGETTKVTVALTVVIEKSRRENHHAVYNRDRHPVVDELINRHLPTGRLTYKM
jgi:hypothetical protein